MPAYLLFQAPIKVLAWAVNKEIKKRGKADRKAYTEKLANEAKHAASVQDMQVKTLAGKFQSPDILVKD